MAATGNEVVLLKQLKDYGDTKLNAPAAAGINGQMLVYGDDGNQWVDVPEGTAYSADNATLQLSGTQFSVKDGGITADKVANGAITADKLASGVVPDVSGFITTTAADGKYAAKEHTHADATTSVPGFMSAADKTKLDGLSSYVLPEATSTTLGGVKVATDMVAKAFLGY